MLELRTLGRIDLRGDDGRRIGSVLLHAKRVSLLAHLCASNPPRLHRRASLLALFWPELDEAHARGALRHELYELRRTLGAGVLIGDGGDAVGVDEQRIWCDAQAFEVALDSGHPEDALDLYRGEFLAGLEVDTAEFEHSLEKARARLSRRAAVAARALAARAEEGRDLEGAVAWTRRETELAPYDESGWQRLIFLLDRIGDRGGALKVYDSLAASLRNELEIEPSPETIALVDQVRRRSEAFTAGPAIASRTQSSSPTALMTAPLGASAASDEELQPMLAHSSRNGRQTRTVIKLLPVENQSGESAFDAVGRRVGERLAQALVETPFLELVSGENGNGARATVSATLFRRGDQIEVRTALTEAGDGGRILEISRAVPVTREAAAESLDTIAAQALAGVAAHYDPRAIGFGDRTVPFKMRSWQAYLEYLQGSELYGSRQFAEAARRFMKAYEMDPSFVKAALFGAIALFYARQSERAEAVIIEATSGRVLTDYERCFAAWILSDVRGRRPEAYRAAKELSRITQHPVFVGVSAWEALWIGRPREALRTLQSMRNVGHGWWRNWTYVVEMFAGVFHVLNDHSGELAYVRDARGQFPEALDITRAEVRARAALGEPGQVLKLVGEALTKPPTQSLTFPYGEITPADVGWTAAQELDAHDELEAAKDARALALQWSSDRKEATFADQVLCARLLVESGDANGAALIVSALSPPEDPELLGVRGLVCAALGDEPEARTVIADLEGGKNPYLCGRHLLMAAGIRAAIGDGANAVKALQRAFAAGLPFGVELHALPMLRPLAERCDFQDLLRPRA